MKKKILIAGLIFLILLLVFPLILVISVQVQGEDEPSAEYMEDSGFLLGTIIRIKIYGEDNEEILDRVFSEIERYESLLSVNISDSQVSLVNDSAGNLLWRFRRRLWMLSGRGFIIHHFRTVFLI